MIEGCHEETRLCRRPDPGGEWRTGLEEWNGLFTRHCLKISLEKTEVLHIGHQRGELDIDLERKKLTAVAALMHLPKVFIKRSHSALALGQYGVIRLCLKPR